MLEKLSGKKAQKAVTALTQSHFTCHRLRRPKRVMSRSHNMFVTGLSYQEVDGMAVELGEKDAKPVTTVQVCVSTFPSVTPLDIFKKNF